MDKIIELITKAWDECGGNRRKQGVLIFLAILAIAAIITAIYFYWWLISLVLAGFGYLAIDASERKKAQALQKQQRTHMLQFSVIYILRHALAGLESLFGIPAIGNKGFNGIIPRHFKSGVLFFDVFYLRLPNLSDLTLEECKQLMEILNSTIQSIIGGLPFENVMPVDVCVVVVQTKDGKLAIKVIPLVDADSRAEAEKCRRWIAKQGIIGKTEENTAKVSNDTELTDDEL